ncbi:helix-hairpin-helix domain-containing protein [Massilia sp. TS11]|uniref:helix-hairpin-helix domain-containing protein n=1 Tax=Massilia sp. TS11 TaxID=2908003 RepID=UPI001EDAFD26|nr:helix-hairpin-helix domain-containing protein [Massilia sp. TS11]MCG2585585.1 helix-hairpin-helix domain-containing protein [Massilia sp. TS11]
MPTTADLKDLQRIPGVGPSIARDLWEQGFRRVADLQGADPEAMYRRQCALQGCHVDRCWLYVARGAVYYAETVHPEPEKLKWWHWKD